MFNSPFLMIDSFSLSMIMQKAQLMDKIKIKGHDIEEHIGFADLLQKDGSRAMITIDGPIGFNPSMLDKLLFGAVSTQDIMQAISNVSNDDDIKSVVFAINSPGGEATKMHVAADMIHALSQTKATAAVNTGSMASAAFYLGSQASNVFVDDVMNRTGSIGTKVLLHDTSKAAEMAGIEVVSIATGPFKAMLEQGMVITPEHIDHIQEIVNELQAGFSQAVERSRTSADMSDGSEARTGKTFSAHQAQDLGLIDGIKTIPEAFEMLEATHTLRRLQG